MCKTPAFLFDSPAPEPRRDVRRVVVGWLRRGEWPFLLSKRGNQPTAARRRKKYSSTRYTNQKL